MNSKPYEPTAEEIRERSKHCRDKWTPDEEQRRRQIRQKHWSVPQISFQGEFEEFTDWLAPSSAIWES